MKINQISTSSLVKTISTFSILMGLAQMATWLVLFGLGNVPEIITRPLETWMLLVAEFITGFALVFGGYAFLTRRGWGLHLELAALGMLFYCTVFSTGVFGQQGNTPAAAFFAIVAVLSALSISVGLAIEDTRR